MLRSFDQLFDAHHPLRKIHPLPKLGKIGLNLRVLEIQLGARVVDQLGLERPVVNEGCHHIPIAVDLEDEAAMLSTGGDNADKFVC